MKINLPQKNIQQTTPPAEEEKSEGAKQNPPSTQEIPPKKEEQQKPLAYKNPGNRRFVLANGLAMKTVNGIITPKTAEELELCAYFEEQGKLQRAE